MAGLRRSISSPGAVPTQRFVGGAEGNDQPATGLQLRDHPTSDRLLAWGGMCSHKVNVSELADVDDELVGWLREAYERN